MNGKRPLISVVVFFLATTAMFYACAPSIGRFNQATGTGVNLEQNNYRVIKASATGVSSGFRLLGIIPFKAPSYAEAKKNLYASAGESLDGRAIALANQTEDRSSLYVILFSLPKLTISADIVEFISKDAAQSEDAAQSKE